MKRIVSVVLLLWVAVSFAQNPELRGVWFAWAGGSIPSKTTIATYMDSLAHNGINTVFVDVWRYGFPYYKSDVFYQLTGKRTDERNVGSRDVLEDMIAEAHRNQMEVVAWFEWGFAVSIGSNDDIFRARPDWFAKTMSGSVDFTSSEGAVYKWLSHCNREAQQFMIDLCKEVIIKYDIDGIELDRIRYPQLDCGYDSATIALYQSEHDGASPPYSLTDSFWKAWRAEKLTDFMRMVYDTLKTLNPNIHVSNAPIQYRYGFDNFCQDWRPWINEGYLDFVSPQVYWLTNQQYLNELNGQLAHIQNASLCYPGITATANGQSVATSELVAMIRSTRSRGLNGHVIWYHAAVLDDLPTLKQEVYQQRVTIPGRSEEWRQPPLITLEDDTLMTQMSTNWKAYSGISGYKGGCYYTDVSDSAWVEYQVDIPCAGWYEIYPFLITHYKAHTEAPYIVTHAYGIDTLRVDQSNGDRQRWFHLGDYYFNTGEQAILRITSQDLKSGYYLFTDALMLLNTNRLRDSTQVIAAESADRRPVSAAIDGKLFPNPAKDLLNIQISLAVSTDGSFELYDLNGRCVQKKVFQVLSAGTSAVSLPVSDLPNGIYIYRLTGGGGAKTGRVAIIR